MNGLTWFQARDLAYLQGRAIRRTTWRKWLFYRFRQWLISEAAAGAPEETLRVARAMTDFTGAEFLAKDWTDELYEGGTYPPCTTPGPVTELAPSSTGGAAAWSLTEACAGPGQGGNVVPPDGGGDSGVVNPAPPHFVFDVLAFPAGLASADLASASLLAPDDIYTPCWTTPPTECTLVVIAYLANADGSYYQPPGVPYEYFRVAIYIALDGSDLSGDQTPPFIYAEPQWGVKGPSYPYNHPSVTGLVLLPTGGSVAAVFSGFPYTPGATISLRADARNSVGHPELIHIASHTFPPLCD